MSASRPPLPAPPALLAIVLAAACGGTEPADRGAEPAGERAPTSLLLITLDTTRADRLGCYGYEAAETPNLDELASRGARFTRAYAHVPLTLPTHASLLTGLLPPEHGIHDNGRNALAPEIETLAEIAQRAGYRTGAFLSAVALDSAFGLDQGFEVYADDLGEPAREGAMVLTRRGGEVADDALTWLRSLGRDEAFFAWAHFYDPHARYEPPPPYDTRLADPYDGEIAYMDAQIGRLFGWLASERRTERTIVVAIADHGESLGEHGETTHGSLVFEGTQRIPFLLAAPGRVQPGTVVDAVVEQIDLLPTLCELLGLEPPEGISGRSLVPLFEGESLPPRPAYVESEYAALNFGWAPLHGLVTATDKLIVGSRPRLFDLARDPREQHDLAPERPERVSALSRALESLRARMRPRGTTVVQGGDELAEALEGLGYTQSLAASDAEPTGEKVDPIDRIEVLERYHEAVGYGQAGRPEAMVEPLEYVVAQCPDGVGFRALLGAAYTEVGRVDEAIECLRRALELDPEYDPAHYYLARAYQAAGKTDLAIEHFRLTIRLQPNGWRARVGLAQLLVERGDLEGALEQLEAICERKPASPLHWRKRAELLGRLGRWREAAQVLLEGHRHVLGDRELLGEAAWILCTAPDPEARDPERALALAREAARGAENDPVALDTLAAALAANGRFDEAVRTAERALARARAVGSPEAAGIELRLSAYRAGERPGDG